MNIRPAEVFLALAFYLSSPGNCSRYKPPSPSEVNFPYKRVPSMKELIEDAGHLYEMFNTTTEDGYILALHRIIHRNTKFKRGAPVLFVVGFGFESESWLVIGNSSLPIVLTELGYDVWLGDPRGCVRSLEHINGKLEDWRHTNYSFHERGVYDLPAFIDKILKITGDRRLFYVGHSLGAGALIIMNSERPDYTDKILAATMIAPAGHFLKWEKNHFIFRNSLRSFVRFMEIASARQSVYPARRKELKLWKRLTGPFCTFPIIHVFCKILQFTNLGITESVNWDTYFYQVSTSLTTLHLRTLEHAIQCYKHGRFIKFDYGTKKNLEIYGQPCPPTYKFNNTRIPVYLIYGGSDFITAPGAAEQTASELGNVWRKLYIKNYNHWDFLMAPNAPQQFYGKVVDFFDRIQTRSANKL